MSNGLTKEEAGSGFLNGRISKREQYHWSTKTSMGEFAWIHKSKLCIDERYQRDQISHERIRTITKDWSWIGLGALSVACRPDGTLLVMDGQHRKLAADQRDDIQELPCMVFELSDVSQEAKGFLDANTVRGPVKAVHKFKAELVACDPLSLAIHEMCERTGYKIVDGGTSDFTVTCVAALRSAMDTDSVLCRKVWALCVEICEGKTVSGRMFQSLFVLERFLSKSDESIFSRHNHDSLVRAGASEILKKIMEAHHYYGQGGAAIGAQGITNLLNFKRRSRQLPSIKKVG